MLKFFYIEDKVRQLPPIRGTAGSAGIDLSVIRFAKDEEDPEIHVAHTNLGVIIPEGFVGLLTLRSSAQKNWHVTAVNSPGIIDADYRGELRFRVRLDDDLHVPAGTLILQLVVVPFFSSEFGMISKEEVYANFQTPRGAGGFGSTTKPA